MRRLLIIMGAFLILLTVFVGGSEAIAQISNHIKPVNGSVTIVLIPLSICGDIDDDQSVNLGDAVSVLQIILGLMIPDESQRTRGDTNQDGSINIIDAVDVIQFAADPGIQLEECNPLP